MGDFILQLILSLCSAGRLPISYTVLRMLKSQSLGEFEEFARRHCSLASMNTLTYWVLARDNSGIGSHNTPHRATKNLLCQEDFVCSGGRIRTYNLEITLILWFPKGVDYIFALSALDGFRCLGI